MILFQARGLDLSRVRACVVVAEERPRMSLTYSFSKLFKDLGLHPRSVSTAFGCRVNLAICLQVEHLTSASSWMDGVSASMVTCSPCPCCDWLQGTSGPDPTTVYVDMRALRHDRYKSTDQPEKHENNSKGTFNKTPTGQEKASCGVINSCVCVPGFVWWRKVLLTVCP